MSVNPVQGFGSGSEVPLGEAQPPSRQSQSDPSPEAAVKGLSPPDVGTLPKQESSISNHAPAADEVPQDEVKLQQDTEIKDQVIVRYLDKASGQVVLQVPSTEVLAVDRGIYDEFRKEAAPPMEGTKPRP